MISINLNNFKNQVLKLQTLKEFQARNFGLIITSMLYRTRWLCFILLYFQILQHLQPDRPDCREKLEKIQQQIKWTNFPGVQTLLLKVIHVQYKILASRVSQYNNGYSYNEFLVIIDN